MHGEWKVISNIIADKKFYRVSRQIDTSKILHSGNIQFVTDYLEDKELAKKIADTLNENEACINAHINVFSDWRFGPIQKAWIDEDNHLCIEYSTGDWWHYKSDPMEWW